MIEDGLMLVNLPGMSMHTLATLAIVLFGNILPAGVILTLWWYSVRHEHATSTDPLRPITARVKAYRHAA